jgi:hypothetical protein
MDGDTLGNTIVQHWGINDPDKPTFAKMIVQKGKQNWTNFTLDNSQDPTAQLNRKRRDLFFGYVSYLQDTIKSRTEAMEEFARKKANTLKEGWVKAGTAIAMAGVESYVEGLPDSSGFKEFMQSSAGNASTAAVFASTGTAVMGGSGKEIAAAGALAGVGAYASAEMARMGAGDKAEMDMNNMSAAELEAMSEQAVDKHNIAITPERRALMKDRVKWLKVREKDRGFELSSMRANQKLIAARKKFGPSGAEGWREEANAVSNIQNDWKTWRMSNIRKHENTFFKAGADNDITMAPNKIPDRLNAMKGKGFKYNRQENDKVFRHKIDKMKELLKQQRAGENFDNAIERNAMGGLIPGLRKGGGIDDAIGPDRKLVMMAPGEFVVNRESAQGMLPYLSRLNRYGAAAMGDGSMGARHGGRIPGMQGGGIVGGGAAGGESVGGVNIPNNEGLTDAIMQLVDIAQGIRDTVDNSAEKSGTQKQEGAGGGEEAAAKGGATNNITVTVNVERGGGEGEARVETSRSGVAETDEGENSEDDPQKNEKFADMLKASVIQVITEQQRPGGLLAN